MSWQVDYAHSSIAFSVRHMMISKVRGHFEKFEADVQFDEEQPANSAVQVNIAAASIDTRNEQRDNHLRSADFLDAEQYPSITFRSTQVEVLDEHHARLTGDLTVRQETHPVTLDVEYMGKARSPWGTTSYGFSASGRVLRKNWNLTWNQALETGGVLVGDEIDIEVELELVKQAEPQEESAAAD